MKAKGLDQFKRGLLTLIVLKVISEGKSYGYEMMKRIDELSYGVFEMKAGTLYPILYRLEDEQLIKSEWQHPEKKQRSKKYYNITEEGIERLALLIDTWHTVVSATDAILNSEVYGFEK